jgi:para-aminobenzoate synthetase / 4-amino-4-deoxychorismate lyase
MDSAAPNHLASFSLLETMRLENGRVERVERHVARMAEAARYFEYQWIEPAVREAIEKASHEHSEGCWRVRLLLSTDGAPVVECTPQDPFVLHKTTHRVVYERARRSRNEVDDVLLWNRRGEVTESTIANVVAEIDGMRYTPPVRCGLLAGTFRAEQIEAGAIHEQVLMKADIVSASRLWLINSVREWVDAEFVGTK